jgi:hypothetical protein
MLSLNFILKFDAAVGFGAPIRHYVQEMQRYLQNFSQDLGLDIISSMI